MSTTYQVGDVTIHRIVEDEAPFEEATRFLPNLTAQQLAESRSWMAPAALDPATDKLIFCFQSYLVVTPHHKILIDTCVDNDKERPGRGNWHQNKSTRYMDALGAAGFGVDDIDAVMCTHLHVDHVGWNTKLQNGQWVPTFPKARYLFSDRELEYWTARNAENPIGPMVDSVLPIVAAGRADLVRSDAAFGDHIRLQPTPGHTIDHFAVQIGRGARTDAVVTGDLIHSPIQARYPELQMRVDFDPALAVVTRRAFLEQYCDTSTLCCMAHFPSPSVSRVKRWGDGFRCDPVA
ncbi:MAG: MBL fold metallo-hydrolase [Acetobacteraceae bacterium]|nr:MBL fold metallo-hydrolase [Acetobacteraceae bacterium]